MSKPVKIYAENIEPEALHQFYVAMEQPASVQGALMPDAHLGYTLPIGGVIAADGMIFPSWIGYDQGCGVCGAPTYYDKETIIEHGQAIFDEIYKWVPVGFKHRKRALSWEWSPIPKTEFLEKMFIEKGGLKQLGTLGGGNHFIELSYDETDRVWITLHSGSRNVGHSAATHYMKLASNSRKAKEWHFGFDVNSDNGKDYLKDLNFCLEFALENRKRILIETGSAINKAIGNKDRRDNMIDWGGFINRCMEWSHASRGTFNQNRAE